MQGRTTAITPKLAFTHWDHASKGGGATLAVICVSFAAAIALVFIAQAPL